MKKPIVSVICMILMGFSLVSARTACLEEGRPDCLTGDSLQQLMISFAGSDTLLLIPAESPSLKTALHSAAPEDDQQKKKFVSALLALPFPFGFMGAHRVMLGCKPWVPVVYVATFGGCFGLLPLIDFCVILFSKDMEPYENNPNIFMWVK